MPKGTQRHADPEQDGEAEQRVRTRPPRRPGSHGHRAGRRFRMARRALGGLLLRAFGPPVLGALSRSWRTEVHGADPEQLGHGALITLWHGNMLVGMHQHRNRDWQVLVSPSDDGDLSEALLERFGYRVVRGSASSGGARALREMLGHLRAGARVVLTPDGPRGPRHSMNPGVAWMARATGHPIVPLGLACDPAWRFRSWDRFVLPKPRARIAFVWGEPIEVPRSSTPRELERITDGVRESMLALERRAHEQLGLEWQP